MKETNQQQLVRQLLTIRPDEKGRGKVTKPSIPKCWKGTDF